MSNQRVLDLASVGAIVEFYHLGKISDFLLPIRRSKTR